MRSSERFDTNEQWFSGFESEGQSFYKKPDLYKQS